jgi:hypothetical protein
VVVEIHDVLMNWRTISQDGLDIAEVVRSSWDCRTICKPSRDEIR